MAKSTRVSKLWSSQSVRDGRVLPITRWVARLIVPFLVAAFLVLYGVPDRTTEFFAWTIRPAMTPILMGAGYGAGVYFFYRVSTVDEWHRVATVFLGITTFAWLMAIATVLHWENFNHSHNAFSLWVLLFAITPVLVPALWVINRRTGPGDVAGDDRSLPRVVRVFGGAGGVVLAAGALALFVVPGLLIGVWPWDLSPFTARILSGWFALFGVANAAAALDSRWSAARILVQSQILGFSLVLIGVARAWSDFDPSNPATWGVVGGMTVYLFALLGLYLGMETH